MSVVSADEQAAKALLSPEVAEEVSHALGMAMPLDREVLRRQILNDPLSRRKLNAILHARVFEMMDKSLAEVWEVPLLIETCIQHRFEKVILAWCDEATQRIRLAQRLGAELEVDLWMNLQLPLDSKIAHSDWIVRTNMPMPNVRDDIATMIESWQAG